MPDKKSFAVTLIIIYLALVFLVGTAVYALIVYFCLNDSLATNILIWTATLFATIALLYTFNFWKDQKGNLVPFEQLTDEQLDLALRISESIVTKQYYLAEKLKKDLKKANDICNLHTELLENLDKEKDKRKALKTVENEKH